jgi:FHA domain
MKPCPSCQWMLKETDTVCTMCGAPVGGGALPSPPAAAPAPVPPPVVPLGGAYAPPGPPSAAYPAPPVVGGAPRPPPPPIVGGFGASPSAPATGYGGPQPPPPVTGAPPPLPSASGGYPPVPSPNGGGAFSPAPEGANFAVSPWARAAVNAPVPPPLPSQPGSSSAYPSAPTPYAQTPNASAYAQAPTGASYPQPPPAPTFTQPPGPVQFNAPPVAPPVAPPMPMNFATPQAVPSHVAPPHVPVQTTGALAPPPIFTPPPLISPGKLSGPLPITNMQPQGRVLVGFLVTFQSDPSGSFWPLHSGRTQIGRSSGDGVDIAIQDASASSRHATIHADAATGQAFVEDEGSRNGTFLNEQKLIPGDRQKLRDNDRLRLGSTTFVVKLLVS